MSNIQKHYTFFILCLLTVTFGRIEAQKNDYVWLQGYESWGHHIDSHYGNTGMNFNYNPVQINYDSLSMNFDFTNTSFCDSNGQLLFYTNGICVANRLNNMIAGSDSLNAGWLQYVWDTSITSGGYRNAQGIKAFQNVVNQDQYYLVYSFTDSFPGSGGGNIYDPKILVALIDMSANGGFGQVLLKNQTLLQGNFGDELTATKHGNGRDWWIAVQKRNTNCYYFVMLDSLGPHLKDSACLGMPVPFSDIAAVAFSPDGSKLARFNIAYGLNIFDFDRCNGVLSNPISIPLPFATDSNWLGHGVAFSPGSRYLYLSATKLMLQYDMWASDIPASMDTVGIYDGYTFQNGPVGSYFDEAQLAPDGKIYISCGNTINVYNVINDPDKKGDSCHFTQHSVPLPTFSASVPTFPNYRLGALTQSQCDSLSSSTQDIRDAKEKILKIFPNPATDQTTIDYGFTDWNKGPISFEITNNLGQQIYTQPLPMYSGIQQLDITQFAAGMYTATIKRNGGNVAVAKFVKQ